MKEDEVKEEPELDSVFSGLSRYDGKLIFEISRMK